VKPFTIIDVPQGSPEWLAARCGLLTGSRAKDVLATIKSGEAAARRDYRMQLIAERLTGVPQESGFVSDAMRHGTETEPLARAAYEAVTGRLVEQTGFLRHNTHAMGCSLDGHLDDFEGIVEIKCPQTATHLGYLRANAVPANHLPQIRHNLLVTGASFCDFVSYDPRLPPDLALFWKRVYALDLDLAAYERAALAFLEEVDAELEAINKLRSNHVA